MRQKPEKGGKVVRLAHLRTDGSKDRGGVLARYVHDAMRGMLGEYVRQG